MHKVWGVGAAGGCQNEGTARTLIMDPSTGVIALNPKPSTPTRFCQDFSEKCPNVLSIACFAVFCVLRVGPQGLRSNHPIHPEMQTHIALNPKPSTLNPQP